MSDLTADEKQQLLRELKEALYSGVLRVRFKERDVTYQSAAEMRKTVSQLEAELGTRRPRTTVLTTFSKGL